MYLRFISKFKAVLSWAFDLMPQSWDAVVVVERIVVIAFDTVELDLM